MTTWLGLTFLSPIWFWMLLAAPVLAVLQRVWGFGGRVRGIIYSPLAWKVGEAAPWPPARRLRLRWIPVLAAFLSFALIVSALARPVTPVRLPRAIRGIDLILVLDVSSSMREGDLGPDRSRLEVTKLAAKRFIEKRPKDRIGLISFSRYPRLMCPPTLDHRALKQTLDRLVAMDRESAEDATAIGAATALGVRRLLKSTAPSRVVVLLTDGEENVATLESPNEIAPIHAAQLALDYGVRVYAIAAGLGKPDASGRFKPLDTQQLQSMAQVSRGRFFVAKSAAEIDQVYASIDELETSVFDRPRYRREERFQVFLMLGIVLGLISFAAFRAWFGVLS